MPSPSPRRAGPRPLAPRLLGFALGTLALALVPGQSLSGQQLYDFGTAFGRATAVSGEHVLVGEPQNVIRAGRVYVFAAGGSGWGAPRVLTASDGSRSDGFGRALDASGDWAVVGAPRASDGAGATYVFRRQAGNWQEVARLDASQGASAAGSAVAISGDWVAVVEDGGAGEHVVVYRRSDQGFQPAGVVAAEAGQARFGAALAWAGDMLAVCGSDGEGQLVVTLHGRTAEGRWEERARAESGAPFAAPGGLLSQDPYKECGLSASGDRLAVGAHRADRGRGAVHVYRVDPASGLYREAALSAPEGAMGGFGLSVALTSDHLWVGAPNASGLMGRAVRYDRSGDVWSEGEVLRGPGTDFMPVFGLSLAAGDDVAVVGSPGDAYGAGLAVTYRSGVAGWSEAGVLVGEEEGYEAVSGEAVDCADGTASLFTCGQMDLVALLPVQELGASRGAMVNDVWGWTDPETGREYAVVGRSEGTSFVDVTDPGNPVYLGQLPKTEGSRGNAWRDVKVLRNHALVVADNAGAHGMQVFDMTRLRDVDPTNPPTFEADALYTEIGSSHNLAVNEETGFVYTMANSAGGRGCASLHIVDLNDPKNPSFAGCYNDLTVGLGAAGQTHDAQCVLYHGPDQDYQGREICFAFSETAISIGDVTDKSATEVLGQAVMPNTAYIHQGWLTDDHRYLYVNDELDEMNGLTDGTRTMIWDVAELEDPVLAGVFISDNKATDHNLYVSGNLMYQSNYAAGLRLLDISDPVNPREVGYFDTAPYADDLPGFFDGSWSNYPFFESGNILVTSHKQGLFVIRRRRPIS